MDYDYDSRYSSPPPQRRRRSKSARALDALEGGHIREAIGSFLPGSSKKDNNSRNRERDYKHHRDYHSENHRHGGHRNDRDHHRGRGLNRDYYENNPADTDSDDDDYYYSSDEYEEPRRRHHRRRGRSSYTAADSSSYYPRSRSRGGRNRARSEGRAIDWEAATKAAVGAGLMEAWRARNRPEGRMKRVATAAAGAAAVNLAGGPQTSAKKSAFGGLMLDRIINGSRKRY